MIVLLEVHRWTRGKAVLNSTSVISNDSLGNIYMLLVFEDDDDEEEELWVVQ
jgi:hypothetical protein